jgi:hypothetical protein
MYSFITLGEPNRGHHLEQFVVILSVAMGMCVWEAVV